jgi:hypothetical protein
LPKNQANKATQISRPATAHYLAGGKRSPQGKTTRQYAPSLISLKRLHYKEIRPGVVRKTSAQPPRKKTGVTIKGSRGESASTGAERGGNHARKRGIVFRTPPLTNERQPKKTFASLRAKVSSLAEHRIYFSQLCSRDACRDNVLCVAGAPGSCVARRRGALPQRQPRP